MFDPCSVIHGHLNAERVLCWSKSPQKAVTWCDLMNQGTWKLSTRRASKQGKLRQKKAYLTATYIEQRSEFRKKMHLSRLVVKWDLTWKPYTVSAASEVDPIFLSFFIRSYELMSKSTALPFKYEIRIIQNTWWHLHCKMKQNRNKLTICLAFFSLCWP